MGAEYMPPGEEPADGGVSFDFCSNQLTPTGTRSSAPAHRWKEKRKEKNKPSLVIRPKLLTRAVGGVDWIEACTQ
jgi:hypothetical protein